MLETFSGRTEFHNTEAALSWIMRGGLNYFNKLDSDFLGEGNASGIPSKETDHFANNFYRLSNCLEYLCKLWKVCIIESEEWKLLKDIRTLIVHSGEQVSNLFSLEIKDYKDAQLGRILKKSEDNLYRIFYHEDADYHIQIWTDKHDASKNRPENEVDYDERKENFRDIDIFLNAADVRNIILSQMEMFISIINEKEQCITKIKKLPEVVKEKVVIDGDFDKLEACIRNKQRGGYSIENGKHIWRGFGLKRLWEYVSFSFGISHEVETKIKEIISENLNKFWDAYNNETLGDDDLPSLDIRIVFIDYTPDYESKDYFEGEKLFTRIAPDFNSKDIQTSTDVDYLFGFICEVNTALKASLNLKNDVNGVVCDYYVKSVEGKLREK